MILKRWLSLNLGRIFGWTVIYFFKICMFQITSCVFLFIFFSFLVIHLFPFFNCLRTLTFELVQYYYCFCKSHPRLKFWVDNLIIATIYLCYVWNFQWMFASVRIYCNSLWSKVILFSYLIKIKQIVLKLFSVKNLSTTTFLYRIH